MDFLLHREGVTLFGCILLQFNYALNIDRLEKEYTKVNVQRNVKFVDEFPIITSGGISAGINMSFYIIKKLLGEEIANATAKRMEYDINIKSI